MIFHDLVDREYSMIIFIYDNFCASAVVESSKQVLYGSLYMLRRFAFINQKRNTQNEKNSAPSSQVYVCVCKIVHRGPPSRYHCRNLDGLRLGSCKVNVPAAPKCLPMLYIPVRVKCVSSAARGSW